MTQIKKPLAIFGILAMSLAMFTACGESGSGGDERDADGPAMRTVEHAMGETEVPEEPERVAALDNGATDAMLALGVEPAGVTTFTGTDFESYEYVEEELRGVELLGQFVEPNLEAVANLGPDLIVASEGSHGEIYNELTQVAPTVAMEDTNGDFREYVRNVGAVLAMEDEVEERVEEYEREAAEAAENLEGAVGDESVAFLRVTSEDYRLYGNDRLVGPILYGDLGLEIPSLVEELAADENYVEISLERVPDLDAEHLFVLDQTDDEMEELTESPLWQSVPAVPQGNVYPAGRDTWIAVGLLASESMIEDIEEALMD
ncbi:MAG: iron-siderophore ABC transporter substrate-binding protein [Rubrobacter sp.]|nr:iron-siderophore ABC transporter substrate-binding protein [Rubrobacter sp.]